MAPERCKLGAAGHVITKDMSQKIYGALAKLKDYEETGLDPGEVEEAVQRLTP